MFKLDSTPIASEYLEHKNMECTLGEYVVTIRTRTKDSRTGSYARGFKFSSNTYGFLVRTLRGTKYYKPSRYSADHGKSWHETFESMLKQRAGLVKLDSSQHKEFAFDSIQQINKDYDRNYAWHP
jgi:hypothetical protein